MTLPSLNAKRGFTLIELLVVIVIIGVLAGFIFIKFQTAHTKALDAKRKSDIGDVKTALVSYFGDHDSYPHSCASSCTSPEQYPSNAANWGISGLDSYLKAFPKDPKQASLITRLANLIPKFGQGAIKKPVNTHPEVAAATSANSPSSVVDNSSVGTLTWANPANAKLNDNTYTTATQPFGDNYTHWLWATGFGFSIPPGSTINGILAEVERKASVSSMASDISVKIIKNGAIAGTEQCPLCPQYIPGADTYQPFGGSTNLWGTTWTVTDINLSNFGVAYQAEIIGANTTYVDHIKITVYYTLPATAPSISSPTYASVTSSGATLGANVTADGGSTITSRGTCWSQTSAADGRTSNCLSAGGTTGIFSHARTGMPANTLIYFSGKATNSVGTSYADGTFSTTAAAVAPTCSGATTTVNVAASVTATGSGPFTWTATGGTSSNYNSNPFNVTYSTTGTKTVNVSDPNGNSNCTVTVNAAPVPPSCSSVSTASGSPVTLSTPTGAAPFNWSAPGGSPSSGTGSSFTVTYSPAADTTYSVTVTGSDSLSGNCTVTVTAPTGPGTPSGCNIDSVIYCYVVSADHLSFALYAKLENDNDAYKMKTDNDCSNGGATPKPDVPAGAKDFNYCVASPK